MHSFSAEELRTYDFSAPHFTEEPFAAAVRLEFLLQDEALTRERVQRLEVVRAEARAKALPFATHTQEDFLREAVWLRTGVLYEQLSEGKATASHLSELAADPEALLAVHRLAFQATPDELTRVMEVLQARVWNWLRDRENAGALSEHAGNSVATWTFDESSLVVRDNSVHAGRDAAKHFAVPNTLVAVTQVSTGDEPWEISDIGDWDDPDDETEGATDIH